MPKKIRLSGTVIGDRDVWIYEWLEIPYISPSSVHKALEEAGGEDIEIYINSGGGSTWTGSEIYTTIKEYSGFKTVKIPSVAGSAASVFAMAGDKVLISPTAQIFVHRSATWTDGNQEDHEQSVQMLGSVDEGMINAYVAKTGLTRDEIRALMEKETFLDAKRAVELGFADEIMFASEELNPVASANFGTEIPPDVLDKIRTTLFATKGHKEQAPLAQIVTPDSQTKPKEEVKTMDENELKEKHPELYAEIVRAATTAGIESERTRIASIREFSNTPGAASYIEEAITNGDTVEMFAMKMLRGQAEKVQVQADNRKLDAQESGLNKVNAQEPTVPSAEVEAEKKKQVENEMVELAKNYRPRGGR